MSPRTSPTRSDDPERLAARLDLSAPSDLRPNRISPNQHMLSSPSLSATSTDPSPALSAFDPPPPSSHTYGRGKRHVEEILTGSYASSTITLPSPGLSPELKTCEGTIEERGRGVLISSITKLGPPALEIIHPLPTSPIRKSTITRASKGREFSSDTSGIGRGSGSKGTEGRRRVECWGHRGASADFPENTIASFVATCKQGSDGLETDLHITKDQRLICFHDPELDRTTDGTGKIHEQDWAGNLEHVRTTQAPHQPIPMFSEVLDLLMRPENMKVSLNLDCKEQNDPEKLFAMIKSELEAYEGWQTMLAPRIVLGLWHTKFIGPAQRHLPFLPRYAITMSLVLARQHFWTRCHGFSLWFPILLTADGRKFREECRAAGKEICVWTVNDSEEMRQCLNWEVRAIITDKPKMLIGLREKARIRPETRLRTYLRNLALPWSSLDYYGYRVTTETEDWTRHLEREAGKFSDYAQ